MTTAPSEGTDLQEFGIWIGNLKFGIKRQDLQLFFSKCPGTISKISFPEERDQKGQVRNKGFARIFFDSEEGFKYALTLTESDFRGRKVLIKSLSDYRRNIPPAKGISASLWVGNLPFEATKEALREIFGPYGAIVGIRMATFQDSPGKCKGFAHVDFQDEQGAQKALVECKNAIRMGKRVLKVEFASPEATKKGRPWIDCPQKPKRAGGNVHGNKNDVDGNVEEKEEEKEDRNVEKRDVENVEMSGEVSGRRKIRKTRNIEKAEKSGKREKAEKNTEQSSECKE